MDRTKQAYCVLRLRVWAAYILRAAVGRGEVDVCCREDVADHPANSMASEWGPFERSETPRRTTTPKTTRHQQHGGEDGSIRLLLLFAAHDQQISFSRKQTETRRRNKGDSTSPYSSTLMTMASSAMPHKIDVHAHYLPPFYQEACRNNGHAKPDGMPAVPEWSAEAHLQLMDKLNITKSILSISSPGTHLVAGDNKMAAKLARDCNAYAADLKKKNPERFGYFASLPIPDVETCLKEIAQSADEECDGYVFMTNGHGHYLGDELYDPIFDELNCRHAKIFIHPTTPSCPCSLESMAQGQKPQKAAPLAAKYPVPMFEFQFDTARVVTNLFMSGTMKRCSNIQIILPHLGGAFPPLLSRWTGFSTLVPGPWEGIPEETVRETMRKQIWFDLAGFVFPGQIKGLMEGAGVPHSRILYGSDFPFTKAEGVEMLLGKMDEGVKGMFSQEEIEDVYCRNAERLFATSSTK